MLLCYYGLLWFHLGGGGGGIRSPLEVVNSHSTIIVYFKFKLCLPFPFKHFLNEGLVSDKHTVIETLLAVSLCSFQLVCPSMHSLYPMTTIKIIRKHFN